MSALVDQLVAQVIGLEVGLLSCQARLAAVTDDEALHDLRTTVRRLRSLLRPLRGLPGVEGGGRCLLKTVRWACSASAPRPAWNSVANAGACSRP